MAEPDNSLERGLLVRIAEGEPAAARQLIEETGPVVYGFIFPRVGGDTGAAEDILQSTYLEAVRSARSFRGEAALTTWLCAIARRQLARHYQRERRRALLDSKLRLLGRRQEPSGEEEVLDQDVIIRALGRLSVLHRQVLVLRYLDGLSNEEISAELGRSAVQVQSLLQRARDGLRNSLEEGGDGGPC